MKQNSIIGTSQPRVDAHAKVTGKAMFTDDYQMRGMLVAKLLHSTQAHAQIKAINKSEALALEGVIAVLDFNDIKPIKFASAGHPYSLDPAHLDVADRYIFSEKARYVGDVIGAVVAIDDVTARRALSLIEVDYQPLDFVLSVEDALKADAPTIQEDYPDNILAKSELIVGKVDDVLAQSAARFEGRYQTNIVQHAQMEPQTAYAYIDDHDRVVITSSTQIPHISRRVVSQALNIPFGKIKVVKPYLGGGFGNKQDVIAETIVAVLTRHCGGRPVRLIYDREEVFTDTRTRHAFDMHFQTGVDQNNQLTGLQLKVYSNNGAYASHGHSVLMASTGKLRPLYKWQAYTLEPTTVYTNLPTAGAMRGYGSPQIVFGTECHMDDVALKLGVDPIEFRRNNLITEGYEDPFTHNKALSFGAPQCLDFLEKTSNWHQRRAKYTGQTGYKRRGVGMALFSYGTGIFPSGIELSGARIVVNQDGSITLMIGATEIGQGSDTALAQIAAGTIGISFAKVHVESEQNTDVTPFDTGAFASRQTYSAGQAVSMAARQIKEKLLNVANRLLERDIATLDIADDHIIDRASGQPLMPLDQLMINAYYHPQLGAPITADVSKNVQANAFSYGACFAEIEVDLRTGKIEIIELFNVHDSGTIINPQLARGQVHGGISMSLGQTLMEDLKFDQKSGRCLNPNLLDYKLQTAMDAPDVGAYFVQTFEPTADNGQKSLGEPPTLPPAPAIRNALLHATGIAINELPLSQQRVFEALRAHNMLV